ncbi:MAG: ParB/RepB/Spo0J family partition protein [Myxococcota bacterium]
MAMRRNALGRGLDALIPSSPPGQEGAPVRPTPNGDGPQVGPVELPVDDIDPNPDQPRRHFDPEALEGLVASLQRHGVLQPVVVRRAGDRFELVVGERRWRAARQAGLSAIPVVVADVAPRDRLELALVENVQRHDLNPIELAHAFQALVEAGATQDEVGDRVALDRSTIANHLRLLELPRELQQDVEEGRLNTGHAKAILQVTHPERRRMLRDRIVEEGLSVRAAEEAARSDHSARRRSPRKRTATSLDPDTQHLLDRLRDRLQTSVRLVGGPARGRIEIDYFGPDDLDRVSGLILES